MKRSWFVLSGIGMSMFFAGHAQAVAPPYDSVMQKVIDGVIDDGVILVKPGTRDIESLIREQLKYTLGQLNWNDAAPKLSRFKIEIQSSGPGQHDGSGGGGGGGHGHDHDDNDNNNDNDNDNDHDDGDTSDEDDGNNVTINSDTNLVAVHYKARGHIAWSRNQDMPSEQEMILPARGDESGLKAFVNRYFHACTNDLEAERHGYFFFFYPSLKTCPMSHHSDHELEREKGWVVRFPMRFVENDTNTHDKSPEYGRLWDDHKLSVTAIFGKVNPNGGSEDEGVGAYNRFYAMLVNRYGQPRVEQEGNSQALRLTWRNGESALEVHLRLVRSLGSSSQSFISWYQERTQDSDVIIYSGHAGLGDNIDVLVKNAVFKPKKYQIFFVNGCDTFTYVDEDLFAAHAAATPDAPATKYLDIITNSVSVYFARMADGAFTLVDELVSKKKTYHEILRRMDPRQRAIVDGEEDNTWPSPFRDWPRS